jgi:hypothetical protein
LRRLLPIEEPCQRCFRAVVAPAAAAGGGVQHFGPSALFRPGVEAMAQHCTHNQAGSSSGSK